MKQRGRGAATPQPQAFRPGQLSSHDSNLPSNLLQFLTVCATLVFHGRRLYNGGISKGYGHVQANVATTVRQAIQDVTQPMTWQQIRGHTHLIERFRRSAARGRLASTYLFVGPPGVGKRTFAIKLAQALLCETHTEEQLDPCGTCPACQQVAADSHPDLELLAKPADKTTIPLELLIGDREHRMREGLCHRISLKAFCGGRKVAIIDDADHLSKESANCLLKMLEEPPPKSIIILIGTSADRQLPTIRSRSQIIRFSPLTTDVVAELLQQHGLVENAAMARQLADASGGSLQKALDLADPELWDFREAFLGGLSEGEPDSVGLSQSLSAFVNAAGKDAQPRRARMRQIMAFAAEFYRQVMRSFCGLPVAGDRMLQQAVSAISPNFSAGEEGAAEGIQRCLAAMGDVDANANQANILDCWMDDLAEIHRSGRPVRTGV